VAHRVLGCMGETSDHSRRKPGPSHLAEIAERCGIDSAKLRNGAAYALRECIESWRDIVICEVIALPSKRSELLFGQTVSSRVRKETIYYAGDVAKMERG
jgi:hypothetical protein